MPHRGDIQGLRAVAVLLVALGHAGVPFLKGGYVGVDVFFVLSGFLITGILRSEALSSGRVSLVAFYVHRARRILLAAALTLIARPVRPLLAPGFARPPPQAKSRICRLGDTSSRKATFVIGDSHAQMWMPTILEMASATAGSCCRSSR